MPIFTYPIQPTTLSHIAEPSQADRTSTNDRRSLLRLIPDIEPVGSNFEQQEGLSDFSNKIAPWVVPAAFTASLACGIAYYCVSFPSLTIQLVCGAACPIALLVGIGLLAYCVMLKNTIAQEGNTPEHLSGSAIDTDMEEASSSISEHLQTSTPISPILNSTIALDSQLSKTPTPSLISLPIEIQNMGIEEIPFASESISPLQEAPHEEISGFDDEHRLLDRFPGEKLLVEDLSTLAPVSNFTIGLESAERKSSQKQLIPKPFEVLEIREKIENYLLPWERQSFFKALIPSVNLPALQLHFLYQRIESKYHRTLVSSNANLRANLQAFALDQLQKLGESKQLHQVVEKSVFFELLSLVGNQTIFGFLKEKIQQEPKLKQKLLNWIERSKTEEVGAVAANALTILVKSSIQFNEADLREVKVAGADLTGGVFDHAQLQGADLRGAILGHSWLRSANLTGAQMAGVRFGEWSYLQEESNVLSCAYSPDGETCAVGMANGTISVYATSTWGKILTLSGHTGSINSIAYSPDGQRIVSGSKDHMVRVWDMETGLALDAVEARYSFSSVAYSPDGQQIALASENNMFIWDIQTSQTLGILSGHTSSINSIAYSPDGQQIASGSWDETVRVWDVHTGQTLRTLSGHTASINSIAYSPDGKQIASGGENDTMRVWDVRTGEVLHTFSDYVGYVQSIAYSPDGELIVSGGADKMVRVWDAHTGEVLRILSDHAISINSVAYSPNGEQIISVGDDKTVRIWDAQMDYVSYVSSHTRSVNSVAYSPNGEQIVSCSEDETVRVWDADTGEILHTLSGHTRSVNSVAYSPDGKQITSCGWDYVSQVWDAHTGKALHTLNGQKGWVKSVAYSPDSKQIITAEYGMVRVRNADTGEVLRTLSGETHSVDIVYSPDGKQIVSGSYDKAVYVWNADTGEILRTLSGHASSVNSVAYSPDGKQIASCSDDDAVHLWNALTGELLYTLNSPTNAVDRLVYSPDGELILLYGLRNTVCVWNALTGEALHTLNGHTANIRSVAYSPDGKRIASGSNDDTVRIWNVESGQCLAVLQGFQGAVCSIAWKTTPDELYLVTGSADKSVRQWRVKKEGQEYKAILCWSSGCEVLTATGAILEGVQGLDRMNLELLKQRGAVVGKSFSHA